jgi:hypothetical protein
LIQEAGNGNLHGVGTPSFGVGRDNPILKSAIPAPKSPCYLDFASGSYNQHLGSFPPERLGRFAATSLLGEWGADAVM